MVGYCRGAWAGDGLSSWGRRILGLRRGDRALLHCGVYCSDASWVVRWLLEGRCQERYVTCSLEVCGFYHFTVLVQMAYKRFYYTLERTHMSC